MQHYETLEPGKLYHIYNHGVGNRDLFREPDNYEYFLRKYNEYISPVADTYAWVLMPNHFHLLVKILDFSDLTGFQNLSGLEDRRNSKPPHQHFSNLFNAYTKAFNTRFGHRGALFERPFKRRLIDDDNYLKQVTLYIHNNPVHHGFCSHPVEYPWSSYLSCVSEKPTKLKRDQVVGWFGNEANFIFMHNRKLEIEAIESWLEMQPFNV